ncbi:helix-turn-helix domain-containing protein [Xanthomonas campestris]|uniref:helix-turn-helix domain-containing protein n=1 Tax=Xanthomonas campestris TaxID=339 RepID=UPI00237873B0|nr:helix-turn-helix domain-containing protein [Xanthomonas campestris]WDL17319.1 helix-turn-helix domain-containing protein [Xanthomonas campestris pv. campestris]WDL21401.1 helix-turn-helix domain-containing protein [Xanthomonas campestris pv. campestris]WDL26517.1 helix-turn-helix domain-containing protein [Xanthomonas campestris pv. campestris]WDL29575.1 helix-turn-helix domain-containing protein [Xanthomonas campestris pv. campestris]WDL34699.1 helix-turn-helix domain-containing protein [X
MPESSPRALFAARLAQARQLRGLSQRALGDRMGLGKEKGSSRINRYEHQVTAIGFDNLNTLAQVLDVPVAYLLADDASMADAILAFSQADEAQREVLTKLIPAVLQDPSMLSKLVELLQVPNGSDTGK